MFEFINLFIFHYINKNLILCTYIEYKIKHYFYSYFYYKNHEVSVELGVKQEIIDNSCIKV